MLMSHEKNVFFLAIQKCYAHGSESSHKSRTVCTRTSSDYICTYLHCMPKFYTGFAFQIGTSFETRDTKFRFGTSIRHTRERDIKLPISASFSRREWTRSNSITTQKTSQCSLRSTLHNPNVQSSLLRTLPILQNPHSKNPPSVSHSDQIQKGTWRKYSNWSFLEYEY